MSTAQQLLIKVGDDAARVMGGLSGPRHCHRSSDDPWLHRSTPSGQRQRL